MTRILVVDDEIDTLNLLRTILEISGYQAVTTLNSTDAITLAEVEHPDVVLLDIMMPQLDGFTLCKMMRLHPATMNLPIVFVTAYSALDLEDRRMEAGADMVLPKPIGMDTLIEAVEKVVSMHPQPKKGTGNLIGIPSMKSILSATSTQTSPVVPSATSTQTSPVVPSTPTPPPAAPVPETPKPEPQEAAPHRPIWQWPKKGQSAPPTPPVQATPAVPPAAPTPAPAAPTTQLDDEPSISISPDPS